MALGLPTLYLGWNDLTGPKPQEAGQVAVSIAPEDGSGLQWGRYAN